MATPSAKQTKRRRKNLFANEHRKTGDEEQTHYNFGLQQLHQQDKQLQHSQQLAAANISNCNFMQRQFEFQQEQILTLQNENNQLKLQIAEAYKSSVSVADLQSQLDAVQLSNKGYQNRLIYLEKERKKWKVKYKKNNKENYPPI